MLTSDEVEEFRGGLLRWYGAAKRDLPWRGSRDPYAIWVSEIMLQQTRASAVIPYFERFLRHYPDFTALAAASEQELLANWAGLGYYYRARNLQKAAQLMARDGAFPTLYEEITALPGVGAYTAAAVASIAFNLPYAVVDGNVFRVLSRVFDDSTDIAAAKARRHFTVLADVLLDREQPGTFNQAMMELGATICLPKRPQCLLCPVNVVCRAQRRGNQETLPVKSRNQKTKEEHRRVFVIRSDGRLLLWQRSTAERLMPGFWELPEEKHLPGAIAIRQLGSFTHGITFHRYRFEVWEGEVPKGVSSLGDCRWVEAAQLSELPLSTIARKALRWEPASKRIREKALAMG